MHPKLRVEVICFWCEKMEEFYLLDHNPKNVRAEIYSTLYETDWLEVDWEWYCSEECVEEYANEHSSE